MSRAEVDLQISVKKACNNEEVPPKRKHVRACIVYTWDHKNSRAFWNAVKIQPLQSNEVQLFKALIMIHKVLQEGHPNTLKDGFRNRDFLYSLSTVFPSTSSYGLLINQYDRFLLQKLDFHRSNPGFNGTFEYEEYISLRTVNDPNEGYESILHLMDLQDLISDFQKQIFATIHQSPNNLCKVSALVPFISESYGIYKFLVSMLRAMFQQLGDDDALSALVDRFCSQHFNLREFYADCVSIKFLTSLINIPRIATEIPDLRISDTSERYAGPVEGSNDNVNENANANENASANANGVSLPSGNIQENSVLPPGTNLSNNHGLQAVDQTQQLAQQQLQLDAERQNYLQEQIQKQQLFELQMKAQEQKMLQEQQVLRQQQTSANQSRVAELERDLLMFKAQFDHDQEMLVQYDSRVKSMESELQNFNQIAAQQLLQKDEGLKNANEQIDSWAKKYETLAKLYSQLRSEHLNLLAKFKKIQQKISSAQESIMKKEKYEKELKTKNLELAEIIRERDRARMELDRMKVANDSRLEQLSFELKEARSLVSDAAKSNSVAFSTALEKCNDEILHLKSKLQEKEHQVVSSKELINVKESLKAKELDLEVTQESLNEALRQLAISRDLPSVFKFVDVFDVILANSVRRIQDSKYDLISPMQAGNALATPEYLLSLFELCSDTATSFSVALNDVIAEGDEAVDHSVYTQAILSGSELTSILNNLMLNSKGLSKTISPDEGELLVSHTTNVLSGAELFFSSLTTDSMENFPTEDEKIDFVIDCNLSFQHLLQTSSSFIDTLSSKHKLGGIDRTNIADAVGDKFSQTAKAVEEASSFLSTLLASASKTETLEVHESILSLALEITEAVSKLITAATETQAEIVSVNKGTISRGEFYRKNSRWTEGLISASMAVAGATNILIRTADGVIKDENLHEQLIVACNEVAASTAQLVAASRVKAPANFRTCEGLESSSKTVNTACKRLVTQVQRMIKTDRPVEDPVNLHGLTTYEGKTLEMEQQVEILKLENLLSSAREKLAQIRKHGYADNISDDEL